MIVFHEGYDQNIYTALTGLFPFFLTKSTFHDLTNSSRMKGSQIVQSLSVTKLVMAATVMFSMAVYFSLSAAVVNTGYSVYDGGPLLCS